MNATAKPRVLAMPFWIGLLAAAGLACTGLARAEDCGSLESHYGPFDFRTDRPKLGIVEKHHFTAKVEKLAGGDTAATPGPDLEYVLKTFPNHPRALAAVVRWSKKKQDPHPKDLKYSVDCHFERALRFRKDDAVVRMLYATWLGDTNRRQDGLAQLEQVKPGDNPFTTYNLGLVYAELGGYDKALELAHKAQGMGITRTSLRDRLQKAGHWREPVTSTQSASAPGAGASEPAR